MRYLSALLGLVLMTGSAWAEDKAVPVSAPETIEPADPLVANQGNSQPNVFGEPEQPIAEIPAVEEKEVKPETLMAFPPCNDERLMAEVRNIITKYQESTPAGNTYDRRSQQLAVKNITSFVNQRVDAFVPAQNYKVADRIIMLKMNQHLTSDEMELCSGVNPVLKKNIYILLYQIDGKIIADVIDYKNPTPGESPYLSFVYQYDNK